MCIAVIMYVAWDFVSNACAFSRSKSKAKWSLTGGWSRKNLMACKECADDQVRGWCRSIWTQSGGLSYPRQRSDPKEGCCQKDYPKMNLTYKGLARQIRFHHPWEWGFWASLTETSVSWYKFPLREREERDLAGVGRGWRMISANVWHFQADSAFEVDL